MTVRELRDSIEEFNDDDEVYIAVPDWFTKAINIYESSDMVIIK